MPEREERMIEMQLVMIESPFAGEVDTNIKFARACMRDSLFRGESPFAMHLLSTQDGILNDEIRNSKSERRGERN